MSQLNISTIGSTGYTDPT